MAKNWQKILNPLISSIADPLLRKTAEHFAASIPEGSWLRSEVAERILAGLKGLAESYKGAGIGGLFVEKATDFFDFAAGSLFDKKTGDFSSTAERWIANFFEDAQKTLASSPADKLDEVRDRLKKEFELRKEIFDLICEAEKEFRPQKSISQPINWAEIDKKASNWLETNRPLWIRRRPRGGVQ
jgi:hypothetical protein